MHRTAGAVPLLAAVLLGLSLVAGVPAEERTQSFDQDPVWEGRHNHATIPEPRTIRQDFGYSRTRHAGGKAAGELGGLITPAAEPAYYARKIASRTFRDRLTASGTLACTGRQFHVLVGFFNANTLGDWRTPNTIVVRLYGRGDVFYAYADYASQRWRAGGVCLGGLDSNGREQPRRFQSAGAVHTWALTYDPNGHGGAGAITVRVDDETIVCPLAPGHQADGATFNRFGLLNVTKSADSGGEVWLDDVTLNGETESFDADPAWESFQNRRTYVTRNVRPRFDFGYSRTHSAGGKAAGELGGLVFRGDVRDAAKMACSGDRLEVLRLDRPLRASGKVSLRRGVSDSTTLIGFYHSRDSMAAGAPEGSGLPRSFVGVAIEGPSRDGFFFYPVYRVGNEGSGGSFAGERPHILPDGSTHDWSLTYAPAAAGGRGRLTVTLDRKSVSLDLGQGLKAAGARFDRFGIVTTWIDGNAQQVYFDDLTYTYKQE